MQPENAADDEAKTEPATDGTEETAAVEPSPILDPAFDHRAMAKRLMALAGLILPEKELTEMAAKPDEVDEDAMSVAMILAIGHALLDIGEQLRVLSGRPVEG